MFLCTAHARNRVATHCTLSYWAFVPSSWSVLVVFISSGLIAGKKRTSYRNPIAKHNNGHTISKPPEIIPLVYSLTFMFAESVKNMVSLSMPRPHPPVGGRPYSRAVQKFSSITWASSSPASLSSACCWNLSRWTWGSFSSVYALTISFWQVKSSKRSVRPGIERCL